MPARESAVYEGYYNTSPECWLVYTEVVGSEFSHVVLFGQAHQLTVDTYAVQHAGGPHPDKSIGIHLCGLHLVLERGLAPTAVPPLLQRLAAGIDRWPHFPPPSNTGSLTVFDVAIADSPKAHIERVREWAASVWGAWSAHHAAVAALVSHHLGLEPMD